MCVKTVGGRHVSFGFILINLISSCGSKVEKILHFLYQSLAVDTNLRLLNPVNVLRTYFPKINLNFIFPSFCQSSTSFMGKHCIH